MCSSFIRSSTCPRSLTLVRKSAGIVAPSTHWKRVSLRDRRCLIMLNSIPRRLSSDVLLAVEPAARRAYARLLQSFTPSRSVSYSARSHKSQQSSPYSTRNMSVCSRPVKNAAHTLPWELLTTRRILRELQANTETREDSPRKMFGCAAMIA